MSRPGRPAGFLDAPIHPDGMQFVTAVLSLLAGTPRSPVGVRETQREGRSDHRLETEVFESVQFKFAHEAPRWDQRVATDALSACSPWSCSSRVDATTRG